MKQSLLHIAAGVCIGLNLSMVLSASPADRTELEKPVSISTKTRDGTPMAGRATAWDGEGFDLTRGKDQNVHVPWTDLDAHGVFVVRAAFITTKDPDAWIALGTDLLAIDGGKDWADKAFDRALRLDPKMKEKIAEAREGGAKSATPGTDTPVDPASVTAGRGPKMVGEGEDRYWGKLTEEEQAAHVKVLKEFAQETQDAMKHPLRMQETKYFLFYSDLSPRESTNWSGLLDRMYDRLAQLFAVEKGRNIWRGKALIFVFSSADDYRRYERDVLKTDPGQSAGMAHSFGDGTVKIAFYRQQQELLFAHVLVHESVHGFVHRYRTSKFVPSWINEGLAETIADELVPNPRMASYIPIIAREGLQQHGGHLDGMFAAEHIEGWQYPVAETMCQYMISNNKKGYVDFINGIKDGLTWQESLEKSYKSTLPKLADGYGRSTGAKVALQ